LQLGADDEVAMNERNIDVMVNGQPENAQASWTLCYSGAPREIRRAVGVK